MKKRLVSKLSLALLLVLQIFYPFLNAFAETNSSMLPPSNLAAQMVTPDDVKLTWSAVYGATGYQVYEIKDGQLILLGKTTAASYSLNNKEEGSYRYVVSTLSADGESGPSAPLTLEVVYPEMAAPVSLTRTIKNGNDVVLSWDASAYAEKYNVYQTSEDGGQTLVASTTERTYTVTNASEGNKTYAVSAINSLYGESPLSESVQAEVVHPVMTAPAGFTYTVANGNDVIFKWNAVSYATNYKIYQIVDGEAVLKSTSATTTATLTNVPAGDYTYEIRANSERFGESAESSKLSVTVGSVTMAPPGNFTFKIQNTNDVILTWGSVPNATGYKVYQIVDGEKVLKSTVTGTAVTYTKVPAGDYVYEVYSYSDRFGESAEGSRVSLTVEGIALETPQNVAYKIQNGNDIALSWSSVANATSYKVYQIVDGEKVLKSTVTGTAITYTNMNAGEYTYEVYAYSDRFGESAEGGKVSFTLEQVIMPAPASFVSTVKNGNDIALTWETVPYATGYKVYQISASGQKTLKSTVTTGTTVTYGNQPAGDYKYEIHSYSSRFGESVEGSSLSLSLVHPLIQAPANLKETIKSNTSFTLSWDAADYATSYKVYQVINGQKALKSTVTSPTATYSNMPAGEYTYVVHAVSTRFGESAEGAKATFTLAGATMQAPTNVTSTILNGNDIRLSWTAATNATSYRIYQVVDGQKVLKSTVTSTSATYSNLPAGNYQYLIHSYSATHGESEAGSEANVELVHPVMQAPEDVKYQFQNGNDLKLSWTAASYATSYKVYEVINGEKVLKATVSSPTAVVPRITFGQHQYIVHSFSTRFGESTEGSQIDVTMNEYTMQAPENVTSSIVNGNDIVLKWNAATYATAYKVYQVQGDERQLVRTITGTATTFTNVKEGDYTYEIYSYSDRFGDSPEAGQVSLNVTHPIMQAPENATHSIANGNDIVLKWTASTYATAYNIYQVQDGQKKLIKTVTGTSLSLINMAEGDYTYEIYSYSSRFNESPEASTIKFTLTWPVVQPPQAAGTVFNANNMTLTWKAVPWANEYRVYQITNGEKKQIYKGNVLSYKVYNLTEDTHSFEVTAYSTRFGESVPSEQVTEKIVYPDMQAPEATLTLTSDTSARIVWDFVTYANGYNIYELIDGESVLVAEKVNNLSYTVSNLSYANHEYFVTSYSNSFGESDRSNVVLAKLIVDTEAPITKAEAPAGWMNQKASVVLSATDNETGVAGTYYSVDGSEYKAGTSFTIEGEGVHNVSFYSVDKVGNKETAQTIEVRIDQTSPVTKAEAPAGWSKENAAVKLAATDEASGVAQTFYSINGSDYTEGATVIVEKEGVHSISYFSVDKAGNKEEVKTIEVKVDQTAPVTKADAAEAWSKEDVAVKLAASDEASGVAQIFYSINGTEYTEGTSFTVEKEGVNKVSFYSVDKAGNKETVQTIEVKVDRTAPVTKADAVNTWSKEDVTVKLEASDEASDIAQTFYSINSTEYTEGTSFTVEKEGVNKVSFYSVDKAGNKEAVQTIEVKVDRTAPVTQSDASDQWLKEDATIHLTATDHASGAAKTYYSIAGSAYKEGTSFSISKEGITTVSFYTVDQAGNAEEANTIEVKIDKTAPVVSMNLSEEYALGASLDLAYKAEDTTSGVSVETLTFNGRTYENGDDVTLGQPGTYTASVTVTDEAGWTTTVEKTIVVYIPASIDVNPGVIKQNTGVITVQVTVPKEFNPAGFDLSSAQLNGVSANNGTNGLEQQAKKGQFKFNREEFSWKPGTAKAEFRGMLNGYLVVGSKHVEVK
ncbi:Ig-like domain repeat protein [Domibacillus indicus]|uniref:OmpL47-type beta-barrel domain-containing protein n=1 Tax=Domibacillus indicus TaxID=1437523 RepID=UPI00203D27B4|nr:Ig-like domain repeat protein [Domibacillus indicus]MCM3787418.1 Ig-like domain repeat protein [Domibacillus indicus]